MTSLERVRAVLDCASLPVDRAHLVKRERGEGEGKRGRGGEERGEGRGGERGGEEGGKGRERGRGRGEGEYEGIKPLLCHVVIKEGRREGEYMEG